MKTKTDIQRLETWRPYEKKLCQNCWSACCTLPVEAKATDLVRLGLMSHEELGWPIEDVLKRLYKQKLIQGFDPKKELFILAQVSGRDCIYLNPETRRCTVYEKRPDVCRNFPRIGPKPGYCPHLLK